MNILYPTDIAAVDKDIDNYRGIVDRDLDRFSKTNAGALAALRLDVGELRRDAQDRTAAALSISRSLQSAPPIRAAANDWGDAGQAIFAAAHNVGPKALAAAAPAVAVDYRDKNMAVVATAARQQFEVLLGAWDRATEALVAGCAAAAYPKLPAGADEALLRQEAEMMLKKAHTGEIAALRGLTILVASPRRDLAALALSPWASSWASVNGLTDKDLAAVRAAAIEAAKTQGTASEQAAARVYKDVFSLLGLRQAFVGALTAPTTLFGDGRGLGFPAGSTTNLLDWRDGPRDFPPLTKIA